MLTRRRRVSGTIVVALAAVFAAVHLVPVNRHNPQVLNDLVAPAEVTTLLRAACYDCHSRETRWPWYSRVAPLSWFIAHHVDEGRRELDFSDWPVVDLSAQDERRRSIAKEVGKGEMPLSSYRWGHPEARLTAAQRETIVRWAGGD